MYRLWIDLPVFLITVKQQQLLDEVHSTSQTDFNSVRSYFHPRSYSRKNSGNTEGSSVNHSESENISSTDSVSIDLPYDYWRDLLG